MGRQYTEEEKLGALTLLAANHSDVARTSLETRVPERTLRDWRRAQRIEQGLPPDPPSAAAVTLIEERFPNKDAAVQYVLDQFLAQLIHFADDLPDLMHMASPYHRLLTTMHIIDRLQKLRDSLPPQQMTVRVVREDRGGEVIELPMTPEPRRSTWLED